MANIARNIFRATIGNCSQWSALILLVLAGPVFSAPGDIIWEERFNNNLDYQSDWSESGPGNTDIDNTTSGQSNDSLEMFGGNITVTSDAGNINASGRQGVQLSIWIRRGDDSFSENPDAGEDLTIEYLNNSGAWVQLDSYPGGGTPGEILTPVFTLGSDALHSNLRIRFTLDQANTGNVDFWHIDDVVFTELAVACAIIFAEEFDNTTDFTNDWETSGSGGASVSGTAANSAPAALNLFGGNIIATTRSNRINANVSEGQLRVWVRRGSDGISGSENPDNGENLYLDYLNDSGVWIQLDTWQGNGAQGEIFDEIYILPSNALYSGLRIRFRYPNANSGNFDYWHIDDVYVEQTGTCVVTAPAPIADWRLEENTWSGNANEIVDSSSNNLHGRSVEVNGNHPAREINTPVVAGDPGTCYYGNFNGVNDGYLRIDDPGTNSILDLNNEFAVAVWIYPRSWATSDLMSIASKDINFEFHLNGNGQVNWWWGGNPRELTTASAVSINQWHHIVISYESGNQVIYIDGNVAATGNSAQAITLNNDPVLIGTDLDFNNRNFNGLIDEVKIYNQRLSAAEVSAIMAQTHPCILPPAIDHFVIDVGGGSASTCAPYEISITAEDASNNTLTNYTGTIGINTSTNNGNWSVVSTNGNFSPGSNDSGSANYIFAANSSDNGVINLNLANNHAETLTITVNDSANGVSSSSTNLTFSENAFVVNATDSLANDVIAARRHNFQVAMVREDPSTGICSVATNYNVATVKTWLTRGAGDPGGVGPQVSNAALSDNEILGNNEPASANFTLPFVNGVANFSLLANDVGRYALNFHDDGLSFSDGDISGSSSTFVARPFGFAVNALSNPAASNANGAVFASAGTDFSVTVSAVGWSSGDDVNNDGIPDGHSDNNPANNAVLSNNAILPSFGNESPGENVQLSSVLVAPSGGVDSGLGNGATIPGDGRVLSSFANGSSTTNDVYFSEVGIIELNASVADNNYLGAGTTFTSRAQGKSSWVGRFRPAMLAVIPGSITEACGSGLNFSYMGEAFEVDWQIEARNTFNALTANYEGAFAKLDASNGSVDFAARDAVVPTFLSSRLNHNLTSFGWAAGTGSLSSNIQIERNGAPDGPYDQVDIGATATDTDGVSVSSAMFNLDEDNNSVFDHVNLGQTEVRFGRLRLADSFGPETANLPVDFQTEFWSGNVWSRNMDDSCTAIALNAISYSPPTNPPGTIDDASNRTVSIGGGSSTGTYASLAGTAVNFANGDAGHYFTSPGAGNMGEISVEVDLDLYPWLRFDWDQNGNYSDDLLLPTANFTFGSYRGHDRVIFWQELLR